MMFESFAHQILLAFPIVLGAYFSIALMKLPDLSIESGFLFGAILAITAQKLSLPLPFIFLAALLGGGCAGLVSSFFNQILRVPFLLSAIITNGLFHGISQAVLGTPTMSLQNLSNPLSILPFSEINSELSLLTLICILMLITAAFLLCRQLGYAFAIFGNNPEFFKYHGVSTNYVVICGVTFANACAGLGGYLFAQSNGFIDLGMGYGVVLLVITSLMFGKVLVNHDRPTIVMPLLGTILYFFLQQSLISVGFELKYFNAFQAIFVLAILMAFNKKFMQKNLTDHLGV